MAKVEAPNEHYEGAGPGGAMFYNGVATVTDESALQYYRDKGYTVDGVRDAEPDIKPDQYEYLTPLETYYRHGGYQPGSFTRKLNVG